MKKRQRILIGVLTSLLCVFLLFVLIGLDLTTEEKKSSNNPTCEYLALGDSYTIGEAVPNDKAWPIQLANVLTDKGMLINSTTIIAKTGWRTDEMLLAAQEKIENKKFEMVSLLIGVNNEFQGQKIKNFESEFVTSLTYAIAHCQSGNKGVFVVSIPDYGYTPYGQKNQQKISERIDQYNAICKQISNDFHVPFYNITPISRRGLIEPSLVAEDGLHPSEKQYKLWVDHFAIQVFDLFNP